MLATAGVRYPPQLLPEVVATLSSAQAAVSAAIPGTAGSAVPDPQVLLSYIVLELSMDNKYSLKRGLPTI